MSTLKAMGIEFVPTDECIGCGREPEVRISWLNKYSETTSEPRSGVICFPCLRERCKGSPDSQFVHTLTISPLESQSG